jgi:hypothetical protein
MGEIRRGSFGPARTDEIRWGWARYGSPGGERHDKDGNGWAVKDRSGEVVKGVDHKGLARKEPV